MTEEQIIEIYLQYIAKWYGIKPTEQIAEDLDIACIQVECLVDHTFNGLNSRLPAKSSRLMWKMRSRHVS